MSKNDLVLCDRVGCDEWFSKKTHNQRYHDDECCRIATNKRIMEKYYEKRDRKQGKPRFCKNCKTTLLSRYNDMNVCSGCQARNHAKRTADVIDMLNSSLIA